MAKAAKNDEIVVGTPVQPYGQRLLGGCEVMFVSVTRRVYATIVLEKGMTLDGLRRQANEKAMDVKNLWKDAANEPQE